ncbi:MAG: hypothetical protein ACPGN3_01220 [Opitutales bacterium]
MSQALVLCVLGISVSLLAGDLLGQRPGPDPVTLVTPQALNKTLSVTRLNGNQPIIHGQMFLDIDPTLTHEAGNINGPSLVRLPDWLPVEQRADPSAQYYLYFASHSDVYIRMAWAADIEGPYTLYNTHADPLLDDGMPGRGVLDLIDKDERITFGVPKYAVGGLWRLRMCILIMRINSFSCMSTWVPQSRLVTIVDISIQEGKRV